MLFLSNVPPKCFTYILFLQILLKPWKVGQIQIMHNLQMRRVLETVLASALNERSWFMANAGCTQDKCVWGPFELLVLHLQPLGNESGPCFCPLAFTVEGEPCGNFYTLCLRHYCSFLLITLYQSSRKLIISLSI